MKKKKLIFYKIALIKAWFEKGTNFLTYPRYIMYAVGFTTQNVNLIMMLAFLYGVNALFIGWLAYRYKFTTAELEVSNQYDPFEREVRKKLKIKSEFKIEKFK